MKEYIKNVHIIAEGFLPEDVLDIGIADGKIAEIGKNLSVSEEDFELVDAEGAYIMPGLIDMHCCICDPGYEHIEDIATASMSAAKGGFTTITCEPNTKPAIDNKTVVEYITSKSKIYSLVNILPYGSMSIGCFGEEMSEIGEMKQVGIVGISDGDYPVKDTHLLRNVFWYSKMFDLPVMTHCEDRMLSANGGVMHEGRISTMLGLQGIPREAEEMIVARNLVLAECVGNRLHIAHVSTKGSVQLIREAKRRGVNVTCETCPHYFLLTDEAIKGYNPLAKVNPPLRTKEDADALIEGLLDGTIDVIASGHSPTKLEYKMKEFDHAAYGISAFETAFALSYSRLVDSGAMSFLELTKKMAVNPAKILRLEQKGKIEIGADADLTIVEVDTPYAINASAFYSKAKFSPFDKNLVKGNIRYTLVDGRLIF